MLCVAIMGLRGRRGASPGDNIAVYSILSPPPRGELFYFLSNGGLRVEGFSLTLGIIMRSPDTLGSGYHALRYNRRDKWLLPFSFQRRALKGDKISRWGLSL